MDNKVKNGKGCQGTCIKDTWTKPKRGVGLRVGGGVEWDGENVDNEKKKSCWVRVAVCVYVWMALPGNLVDGFPFLSTDRETKAEACSASLKERRIMCAHH